VVVGIIKRQAGKISWGRHLIGGKSEAKHMTESLKQWSVSGDKAEGLFPGTR